MSKLQQIFRNGQHNRNITILQEEETKASFEFSIGRWVATAGSLGSNPDISQKNIQNKRHNKEVAKKMNQTKNFNFTLSGAVCFRTSVFQ